MGVDTSQMAPWTERFSVIFGHIGWIEAATIVVIALVLGFWLAWIIKRSSGRQTVKYQRDHSFARAVSELANGNRERAREILTAVVAENTDEIEAYLALGILFRKQGWFRRAVDIHRRLLSRAMLDEQVRRRAQIDLAMDFCEAGLLDRADAAVAEVMKIKNLSVEELCAVGQIQEISGNWSEAAEIWNQLKDYDDYTSRQSYCLVMKALDLMHQDNDKHAQKLLNQALKLESENPAAHIYLARVYHRKNKTKHAINQIEHVYQKRPDLIMMITDQMERMIERDRNQDYKDFLYRILETERHRPAAALHLAECYAGDGRKRDVKQLVESLDIPRLSPAWLIRLVKIGRKIDDHQISETAIAHLLSSDLGFDEWICGACSEILPAMVWQCPHCKNWGQIRYRDVTQLKKGDII